MTTNSGRAFYFASNELLSEVILGYEQFPSDGVEASVYADAIKKAVASDVSISTEWQPVTVRGLPALRATGKAVKFDDSNVEVTIFVIGRDAWRTLVFTRGNSPVQSDEKKSSCRPCSGRRTFIELDGTEGGGARIHMTILSGWS